MEKLITLVRRDLALDREQFLSRFLHDYVPAVARHQPRLGHFVIDLVDVPAAEAGLRSTGGEPAFDAVTEMWVEGAPGRPLWARPSPLSEAAAGLIGVEHVYHVSEKVEREREQTWPAGDRSPGVKSVYLARRRDDMSHEAFAAHWRDTHAPLALKHHVGMWRYVRNVVLEPLTPDAPPWDGFAELHFRTAQDLRERMYDSDEGRAVIAADIARFSGAGRVLHTSEYIVSD